MLKKMQQCLELSEKIALEQQEFCKNVAKHRKDEDVQTIAVDSNDDTTQTTCKVKDSASQTCQDDFALIREELMMNNSGEITANDHETIVELKFGHDIESWDEVTKHIENNLKMKMSGKVWLFSSGSHFRIVAFRMDKAKYERRKLST